jgi:hypothetical protein
MNKITIKGRTWSIDQGTRPSEALAADLKRRGWDGLTYTGTSHPAGRQVATYTGMFYRSEAGGYELIASVRERVAA